MCVVGTKAQLPVSATCADKPAGKTGDKGSKLDISTRRSSVIPIMVRFDDTTKLRAAAAPGV